MSTLSWFVLTAGVAYVAFPAVYFVVGYIKWHGPRVVVCPKTSRVELIELDAAEVAAGGKGGAWPLVMKTCTRWPQYADCGQECLLTLKASSC